MNNLEKIQIDCVNCGELYTTYINIQTGDIDTIFCSDECGEKYYEKDKCSE